MQVDLIGRVHNISPTYSKNLILLFEAISNSIYTIKDSDIPNEHIAIFIERDNSQLNLKLEHRIFDRLRNLETLIPPKKVAEFAEDAKLITAPDNMGYFGYNKSLTT